MYAGRKHQLRIHCARSLSAPILGDERYGMTRGTIQRKILADLKLNVHEEAWARQQNLPSQDACISRTHVQQGSSLLSLSKLSVMPLQLHSHTLCLQKTRQQAVNVTAEPSNGITALMHLYGWQGTC